MKITDSLTLDASGLTLTRDGYLVGDARVSRAGNVQQYLGSELGLTGDDANKMFGVYRDPDVVFDEASMLSLAGRPVTRGHPKDMVTAENWKDLAKGQVGGVIRRDGEHVVAPMAIMDHEAVKEVEAGARGLSAGYTVEVIRDEGTAPDGTHYQFRQAGALRFNHVAYLPGNNPRAGNTRIGDGAMQWGAAPIPTTDKETVTMSDALRTVVVDGLSVQTTDQGAQAIDKLQKAIADAAKKASETETAHTAALAAKDADLAKKDEEIGTLKADLKKAQDAAPKPADIDKLVADRAMLVTTVKAIDAKIEVAGKTDADLRKAAVAAKLGDEMVKDASEAEIAGMFKALAKDVKAADPFAAAVKDGIQSTGDADKAVTDAYAAMVKDMQSAHQPAKAN